MMKNNDLNWDEFYTDLETPESEESQEDLMYAFFDQTDLEAEEVYSLVFMGGKQIIWQ